MSFVKVSVDSNSVSTTGADMVCVLEAIQTEWKTATATKMLIRRQQYSVKKQQNKIKNTFKPCSESEIILSCRKGSYKR